MNGGEASGEAILAKFCHSCGTRFPISWARFCCMCGEKRLWMNPADKLPPIWSRLRGPVSEFHRFASPTSLLGFFFSFSSEKNDFSWIFRDYWSQLYEIILAPTLIWFPLRPWSLHLSFFPGRLTPPHLRHLWHLRFPPTRSWENMRFSYLLIVRLSFICVFCARLLSFLSPWVVLSFLNGCHIDFPRNHALLSHPASHSIGTRTYITMTQYLVLRCPSALA